jgi:hypothetical protein
VTGDAQSAFAPPAAVASSGTSVPGRITGIAAVVDFTGVKAGLVVLGLVLAGAAAFGMAKIPDDVLAEKASASSCPLERSAP